MLVWSCAWAQFPTPGAPQKDAILILNATAHLGNGEVIKNSAVGFKDGKLILVADARLIKIDRSAYQQIIHADGAHIYPGFIAPNSTLGLTEIGAVRATHDFAEVGYMNPHVRSIIAYNTESKITATVRSNGVLIVQATPRGGTISGSSSVVQLDAWNWEDALISLDEGIHLNWPQKFVRKGGWGEPKSDVPNKKYKNQLNKVYDFFKRSRSYSKTDVHEKLDQRFEAMRGLYDTTKTLYIHGNFATDILTAIHFVRDYGITRACIVGGYDADQATELLKENKISVLLRRVHSLPLRPEDHVDKPYALAGKLMKQGVLVGLQNSGDMEAMNTRNLPFLAGTASAYGLSKEEAVQLITSNNAKILGIEDAYGTLEVGKSATLFISKGDALDMMTNDVTHAFIDGRKVDLTNHQKELYEKYKTKFGY